MGVITTAMQAIADDLTARWLPTFAWEQEKLPARPPVATLWLARAEPTLDERGALGSWQQVDVVLRLYVSVQQRERAGQEQLRDLIDELMDALATDATAAGAVRRVAPTQIDIAADLIEQVLVAELTLEVDP